jgi:hypothetical protein
MSEGRANPFADLTRFKPKTVESETEDDHAKLKTVAERTGFQSRESAPKRKRRGRRSGRTRAFTTKMTPEYHALIYQIADGEIDGQERLVGEVIEQAVDALMRNIAPRPEGQGS